MTPRSVEGGKKLETARQSCPKKSSNDVDIRLCRRRNVNSEDLLLGILVQDILLLKEWPVRWKYEKHRWQPSQRQSWNWWL